MNNVQRPSTFLFVGNGSYVNRGCEALALGTVRILRESFEDPKFVSVEFGLDARENSNSDGVVHHAIDISRYSRTWFAQNILRALPIRKTWFPVIGEHMHHANAVLALGGDNYSMDYGSLRVHLAMIDYASQFGRPFVIWGASVGPFNKLGVEYERYVAQKLRGVTAIFARESVTVEYLGQIGLRDNVYQVADPAFVMEPMKPMADDIPFEIPNGAIGLNFSPLMAHYLTGGDIAACTDLVVASVQKILDAYNAPVVLIAHAQKSTSDDYRFLAGVADAFSAQEAPVYLLPRSLTAPEIKWVMTGLRCFAGARTHSTIAAISAGIPTLSFSYSIKSVGINHDIFGNKDYVMSPTDITPDAICDAIGILLRDEVSIRQYLEQQLPIIKQEAYRAGEYLQNILVAH